MIHPLPCSFSKNNEEQGMIPAQVYEYHFLFSPNSSLPTLSI